MRLLYKANIFIIILSIISFSSAKAAMLCCIYIDSNSKAQIISVDENHMPCHEQKNSEENDLCQDMASCKAPLISLNKEMLFATPVALNNFTIDKVSFTLSILTYPPNHPPKLV